MGEKFELSSTKNVDPRVPVARAIQSIDAWKEEIADCYRIMNRLIDMDPTDIFQHLSQFSARASEMRASLPTPEGKREAQFRIRVIDPFIEECDRQFKIHSRIVAIAEMDARLAGGRFA